MAKAFQTVDFVQSACQRAEGDAPPHCGGRGAPLWGRQATISSCYSSQDV